MGNEKFHILIKGLYENIDFDELKTESRDKSLQ